MERRRKKHSHSCTVPGVGRGKCIFSGRIVRFLHMGVKALLCPVLGIESASYQSYYMSKSMGLPRLSLKIACFIVMSLSLLKNNNNLNLPPHESHTERYNLMIVWEGPNIVSTISSVIPGHIAQMGWFVNCKEKKCTHCSNPEARIRKKLQEK